MTTEHANKLKRYRHMYIKHNYICTLVDRRTNKYARPQGGKLKDGHDELFEKVWNHQSRDSYISIEEAGVTHQGQLQVRSLSTTFLTPLKSYFFPYVGEADLYKLSYGSPQHWEL
jgi:hypothetical protein